MVQDSPSYRNYSSPTLKPSIPMILGIQGGQGSFNEEAAQAFIQEHEISSYQIRYLFTSPNVMEALCRGEITRGQCAIYNSIGGYVEETTHALEQYPVRIVDEFAIQISHTLMLHPKATMAEITTIMCHPQVLAQCKQNLAEKYPHLKQASGEGELVDTAKVAEALAHEQLPKSIAVLGPKTLAKLYGFQIFDDNLQDLKENYTRFVHVERISS